jgi:cytochrome c556
MKKFFLIMVAVLVMGSFLATGCAQPTPQTPASTANVDEVKKSVEDIKGVLPKFAIPMREVGDRFDNMYYAAKGGNWALAAYMSKYMDSAMNPAKVTKPNEYPAWTSFYKGAFDPVNKAIAAKDFAAFDKAYATAIDSCNGCHASMGYKFIKVFRPAAATDIHMDYTLKSEPGDLPK